MKKIAIIGSSGGNLYNLGGKEPIKLLSEIKLQTDSTDISIYDILFIGAKNITKKQKIIFIIKKI